MKGQNSRKGRNIVDLNKYLLDKKILVEEIP